MNKKTYLVITSVMLFLLPFITFGELKLKDDDSGETADYTLNIRFSFENSLWRLEQTRGALESFHRLTDKTQNSLSKKELSEIGNTAWDIQILGFNNWTGAIEGTLRQQDYFISKLEFELAREKFEAGKIKNDELEQKEMNHKNSESEFQQFLDSFQVLD